MYIYTYIHIYYNLGNNITIIYHYTVFHGGYTVIRWSAIFVFYLKRNEQIVINNIKKIFYLFVKYFRLFIVIKS